jgi:hypothetical protein
MHQRFLSNLAPWPDYRQEVDCLIGEGDFVV